MYICQGRNICGNKTCSHSKEHEMSKTCKSKCPRTHKCACLDEIIIYRKEKLQKINGRY